MDAFPNAHLLTTPVELSAAIAGPSKPLVIDLRPAEDFAAGCARQHLDLGAVPVDTDPAPLKAFMWIIDHLFNLRHAGTPVVVYDEVGQQGGAFGSSSISSSTQVLTAVSAHGRKPACPCRATRRRRRPAAWAGAPQERESPRGPTKDG
jgi:rhodanese-related sulfurtransferase